MDGIPPQPAKIPLHDHNMNYPQAEVPRRDTNCLYHTAGVPIEVLPIHNTGHNMSCQQVGLTTEKENINALTLDQDRTSEINSHHISVADIKQEDEQAMYAMYAETQVELEPDTVVWNSHPQREPLGSIVPASDHLSNNIDTSGNNAMYADLEPDIMARNDPIVVRNDPVKEEVMEPIVVQPASYRLSNNIDTIDNNAMNSETPPVSDPYRNNTDTIATKMDETLEMTCETVAGNGTQKDQEYDDSKREIDEVKNETIEDMSDGINVEKQYNLHQVRPPENNATLESYETLLKRQCNIVKERIHDVKQNNKETYDTMERGDVQNSNDPNQYPQPECHDLNNNVNNRIGEGKSKERSLEEISPQVSSISHSKMGIISKCNKCGRFFASDKEMERHVVKCRAPAVGRVLQASNTLINRAAGTGVKEGIVDKSADYSSMDSHTRSPHDAEKNYTLCETVGVDDNMRKRYV